jgi:hypothetical protein
VKKCTLFPMKNKIMAMVCHKYIKEGKLELPPEDSSDYDE